MRSHVSHAKVSAAGCKTMALLVCEGGSKTQTEIVAEGGVELIIAGRCKRAAHRCIFERHVHFISPDLDSSSLFALAMDAHSADSALQMHACGAMSNLACRNAGINKHLLSSAHGCITIPRARTATPSMQIPRVDLIRGSVIRDSLPAAQEQIVKSGGIQRIVSAMLKHASDVDIQMQVLNVDPLLALFLPAHDFMFAPGVRLVVQPRPR